MVDSQGLVFHLVHLVNGLSVLVVLGTLGGLPSSITNQAAPILLRLLHRLGLAAHTLKLCGRHPTADEFRHDLLLTGSLFVLLHDVGDDLVIGHRLCKSTHGTHQDECHEQCDFLYHIRISCHKR